jgi:large subunit ribosomal protein L19
MALKITIKETEFGVGDRIRVVQKIKEAGKSRESTFEGMVLGIKGREPGKTFLVRRVGEAGVGIERIFPVNLPSIEKIVVVKRGTEGVKRSKLYYTRLKAPTEIEMIYKRSAIKLSLGKKVGAKIKSAAKTVKAKKVDK